MPELFTVTRAKQFESVSSRRINFNYTTKRSYFNNIFRSTSRFYLLVSYALLIEKFCMSKTSLLQVVYLFLKFYTKPTLKRIYQVFKSVLLSVRKWQLLWHGEPQFSSWCYYFSLLTYAIFCSMTNQNFQHDPCPFLCIGWRVLF